MLSWIRGFSPHHIRNVGEVLTDNIEHYIFISSLSVYKDWIPHHIKEDYILQPEPTEEQIKAVENGEVSPYEYYGALKVLCEKEAEEYYSACFTRKSRTSFRNVRLYRSTSILDSACSKRR